jgi:hypothetical protein
MAGRKINDYGGYPHSSDMSMKSKTHLKEYHSTEGSGGIKDYPDTTENIQRDQKTGDGKVRAHPMKTGYRY